MDETRAAVILVGANGLYMATKVDLWDRFAAGRSASSTIRIAAMPLSLIA